ncbi:MAG: helix-hairpin-helix domain-containing protein [Thermoleophilaceae bacterium]|nr:helix-hairpin-helix domain-containing protein [Thermoleophilaceae bacterium]
MERSDLARLASWAIAGVLVVALGAAMLRGREGPAPPEVSVSGPGAGERPPGRKRDRDGRAAPAYVSVAGEVRRPGLVRVRSGARVGMAVRQAGGITGRADLAGVNLAARVKDGQQVVVPRRGAALASGAGGSAGGSPGAGAAGSGVPAGTAGTAGVAKVSLATATVEQLDTLDGIGPTLAQRIVRERDARGGFKSVGELKAVEGIGEKRFAALRDALAP